MLSLQVAPAARPSTELPIDLLLACHARMRRFSELAVRLATVEGASAAETTDAAKTLHRYFDIALPLHVQDEDQTLRPRLLELGDNRLHEALDQMFREHVQIDAALLELLPRWQQLAALPELRAEELPALKEPSIVLQQALAAHLLLEEERIFPSLARLRAPLQLRIIEEMRARRAPRPKSSAH